MRLGLNTYIYEIVKVPAAEAIKRAAKHGFRFFDFPAYGSGDPRAMSPETKKEIISVIKDNGLYCSQLLFSECRYIASADNAKRTATIDYMKHCADWQLAMGGKQVIICWGCGVTEMDVPWESSWMNSVESIRTFCEWANDKGICVSMELDPHIYFVVNSTAKSAKMIEDVNMPNLYANIDTGHMNIIRESPKQLEKVGHRVIHTHLSETDTFHHTNSILGTGSCDFKGYVSKLFELGVDQNTKALGENFVACIEIGSRNSGIPINDPDEWVRKSLDYCEQNLPNVKQ